MLGDILFSTQFLITHLVTTFSVGDNLGIYLACDPKHKMSIISRSVCFYYPAGQTEQQNMLILFLGTTRKYRISRMTSVIITDKICHDQVTDQELVAQNVVKHVIVAPTV